jgi:hypothetical protein
MRAHCAGVVLSLVGLLALASASSQPENNMEENATAMVCPDGWEAFGEHCYQIQYGTACGSKMQKTTVKAWVDIWPRCIHWLKIILFITSILLAVPCWEQRALLQG